MKKVVVIGAGTMGLDIAQTFAAANFDVWVRDISDEIIYNAKRRIEKSLDKMVAKNKFSQDKRDSVLSHLSFTTDIQAAQDSDLVIEAIVEDLNVKKNVFNELDKICDEKTIFASNTLW